MDDMGTEVAVDDGTVSEIPLSFSIALWFPVVCVMIWFVARLMGGEWLDQQPILEPPSDEPRLDPVGSHIHSVDPPDSLDDSPPLG